MFGIKDLILPKELRTRSYMKICLMLVLFLSLVSADVALQDYTDDQENTTINWGNYRILERDVLAVFIKPVVVSLSARCEPLYRGNPFDLYVSLSNDNRSIVELQPRSEGTYNLTIIFLTNRTWSCTVGVFTRNPDFYKGYGSVEGSFVEFPTLTLSQPGNYTIVITVDSHKTSSSSFFIRLPTPVNAALLITAAGAIAYFNAFLICDTYFKSKKEIVSGRRWMVCGVVMIISILLIYQLYDFTAITLAMEH
ncbi:MAG: hypothetical protein ACE5NN_04360 [Candidatus Bathyarchaeia archaeon]